MALAVFVVPLVASVVAAVVVSRQLPVARSWPQLALFWAVLGAVATAVLVLVDRIVIRLIPIPALTQLSALFPDRGIGRKRAAKLTDRALEDLPEPPVAGQDDLVASFRAMLTRLQRHDHKMAGHAQRVRRYSDLIAEELELVPDDRHRLEWAALLHDVGKLTVPERALQRTGALAPDEVAAVRQHPEQSGALTSTLHPWLGEWALAITQHHERWDGGGYPSGLTGEAISLGARIVAVADAYDAMTGPRSYQPTLTTQAGRQAIADGAGSAYDPTVVRAFLNISIRRLRVVSGGLTWGLQSRATGLIDTATRLATTGTAILATGAALAIGGTLIIPTLERTAPSIPIAVGTPSPTPDAGASPTPEPSPEPTPELTPEPAPEPPPAPTTGPPVTVPVGPVAPPPAVPGPSTSVLSSSWTTSVPVGSILRPGERVTVTFTLTNGGPDAADGVTATIGVPPGVRGLPGSVAVDGVTTAATPFTAAIALPVLPAGGSTTLTYTLEVPVDATSGLVDPPFITVTSGAGTTTFNSPGGYAIDADPAVSWTVAASPTSGATVIPGGRVTFTATVTNAASAGANSGALTLAVALPPGLTPDPATIRLDGAARSPAGLAAGLTLPNLAPGGATTLVLDALVDAPQPDGTVLTTMSTLTGPAVGALTTATTHVIDSAGAVSLSAATQPAPGSISPGATLTYTYTVTNDAAATATATGLTITAPTPADTTYVAGSTTLDGVSVPDASNPLAIGFALPPLAPGASATIAFQVTVDLPLTDGTVITAASTVTGEAAPLGSVVTHVVSSAPALSLVLTPDRAATVPVIPGDVVTYTLTLTNAATATASATGVTLALPTPTDTTFVPGSAVDASGATLTVSTNPFATAVAVPDVAPGASVSVTIAATVNVPLPAGTLVSATGKATATEATTALTATTGHTVTSTSDVSVTLAAVPPDGGTVTPGDPVTMTLTVTNGSAATATATGLGVTEAGGTGFVDVGTATLDGGVVALPPDGVPLALPDLGPGESTVLVWASNVVSPQVNGTVLATTTTVTGDTLPAPVVTSITHLVSSSPDLTLTIAADRLPTTPVVPGDVLTYTLTLTNDPTATEVATGITLRLPNPPNTAFVPGSAIDVDGTTLPATTNPFSTGVGTPPLRPGDSTAISIKVTVASPLPNGSALVASATADAAELVTPITRSVTHTISSAPIITLTTDSTPLPSSTVLTGSPITYRVEVGNDAAATENAVGLDVRVPTPQNTTFVSAVDHTGAVIGITNPFETSFLLPALPPGGVHVLELTVAVDVPLPNGTPIQQVTSLSAVRLATPLTATIDHLALSDPLLSVSIEAFPDITTPVAPGTVVTYAVTVANAPAATATATFVVVSAPDPADATYVPDSAVDENGIPMTGTPSNPFAGGYPLPDLAPGDFKTILFDVTIASPLADGTVLRQVSTANSDELILPVADVAEHTVTSAPDLSLSLRALPADGTPVTPGDTIRYIATIANSTTGTETATGIGITLPTPADTTYVTDSAQDEAGTTITGAVQPFDAGYTLPDLAPGDSVSVEFQVTVDLPLPNGSTIAATGSLDADQLGAPLTAGTSHPVSSAIDLAVDLRSTPTEGSSVTPGDVVAYRVAVTNGGTATETATGVTASIPTPPGTTYLANSARDQNGDPVAGGANPFAVGWALPDLAPGAVATLQFEVTVDSPLPNGTTLDAVATADAAEAPSPVNDPAPLFVSSAPSLSLTVTATPPVSTTVVAGSTITYRLRAANAAGATETATGLTIFGSTPADTTYVTNSARDEIGGTIAGPNPFIAGHPLPDLAPGAFWEVSYVVTVDSPLPDGTIVTQVASLTGAQLGTPLTTPASHTVSSAVLLSAELNAVPAEGGAVVPGSTVSYDLTITNDSTATQTATGITATIPTPADTTYAPNSAQDETGATITGSVNPFGTPYALPDLAPGASWTLRLDVVVDTPLPNGTALLATATVDADQVPSMLTDGATHTVTSAPALTLAVETTPTEGGKVIPGDTVTYSLTVSNGLSATEVATGLDATLPLANDTAFVPGSAVDQDGTGLANATNPFATGWALPDLAPGDSWTITFDATVDSPLPNTLPIDTTGTLTADQLATPLTDSAPLEVLSSTATFVSLASVPLTTQTVRPTRTITYQLTVGNAPIANETATGPIATLLTPVGTTYVEGSARDENGDPITGTVNPFASGYGLADLAPGDSRTISIDVTVNPGVADGSTIDQTGSLDINETTIPKQETASHTVEVYVNSPFLDKLVVSEVLYLESGSTLLDNDEAVELRNLTADPIDISGWTIADVDILGAQLDTTGSVTFTFPPGSIVPAYGHGLMWLGVDQTGTRSGFTNLIGSFTPEWWVGSTAVLDAAGDDIWLYDGAVRMVDRIAWGSGSELAPAPPAGITPWGASAQPTLAIGVTGQSIASTPSTAPTLSSACYEPSTSAGALGDPTFCPEPPTTLDTDAWPGRVTSLGEANTRESFRVGQVAITEVLYRETGGVLGNDEAIEFTNLTASPLDLGGWTIADGDVDTGYAEGEQFTYVFPAGTTLPAGGIGVLWIGSNNLLSLPGFTNVPGGTGFERYANLSQRLNTNNDDLWLYDPAGALVEFVAWGSGGDRSDPPTGGFWDPVDDGGIDNSSTGQSIASTPAGFDANSSACWEHTGSDAAIGDPALCPVTPVTLDTDTWLGRVTSIGRPNT